MDTERAELCVTRLRTGHALKLENAVGCAVRCCAGVVWLTQNGDGRDIWLTAGETFIIDRAGLVLITGEEGAKGEWLEDVGYAVLALPRRFTSTDVTRPPKRLNDLPLRDEP